MALNQTDVMLAILGLLLMVVGYIGAFVYYIITLIENFKDVLTTEDIDKINEELE